MRLFAAIFPPRAVLEEVRQAVEVGRQGPPVTLAAPTIKRRIRGRFGRDRVTAAEERRPEELVVPPLEWMYLPITSFGNVAERDSVKLLRALRDETSRWRHPTVYFAGGAALEFVGDESVWARLDGDLDALMEIGRGVPQVAQRLGFLVDRQEFRPWLSVGTITQSTTEPFLKRILDSLDALQGQAWTVQDISVMRALPKQGPDAFAEVENVPLKS